jgi:hypothetical protein
LHINLQTFNFYKKNSNYRKVASSRPVYYSILELYGQRSQYISIKFPLHKPLKIWKCATNRDRLLLATLRYAWRVIIRVESCKVDRKRSQISRFPKITFSPFAPMFHDAYPKWFFLITKGLLAMALSSEFRQNQGSFWQMYRYPRILSHSTLLFIRCFLAIDLLPIRIYNLICARFFFRTERFFLYEMDKF